MRKKIILIVLTISMVIYNVAYVPTAKAWPVFDVITEVTSTISSVFDGGLFFETVAERVWDFIQTNLETFERMLALTATQMAVDQLLGKGSGKSPYVSNWNQYLYLGPQQRTMTYLQGMFNQSTRGRASLSNYEGVGQLYDQYLLRQAQASISPIPMTVNLRDYANDPRDIFAAKSFRPFNAWLNCPNNPDCITLIAQSSYANELQKQTTVANKEQTNGFLAQKKNGRIITPAALVQKGFTELDKYGTDLIINAQELGDILLGAVIRIAGAGMQAAYGDENLLDAARQRNATKTQVNFDYSDLRAIQNDAMDAYTEARSAVRAGGIEGTSNFVGPTQPQ